MRPDISALAERYLTGFRRILHVDGMGGMMLPYLAVGEWIRTNEEPEEESRRLFDLLLHEYRELVAPKK